MGKPLNWMLSGIVPAPRSAGRALRSRLAATTILAVVPFLGYGRQAYAECIEVSGPPGQGEITHICSGATADEAILGFPNANVTTAASPAFVATGGVEVTGPGHIQFTDANASIITNDSFDTFDGTGLWVESTGAYEGTPGAVTIDVDSTISGTRHGIAAYNRDLSGSGGNLSITVRGDVTGQDVDEPDYQVDNNKPNDGIHARNYGNDLTITTTAASTVSGEHNAIDARNFGRGDLTITADGALTSHEFDGVFAYNDGFDSREDYGSDLTITLGAQSSVFGAGNGVNGRNFGNGDLNIEANGYIIGNGADGIRALNVAGEYEDQSNGYFYDGEGRHLTVTTGADSVVLGYDNGIDARNAGSGDLTITANGYVTGYGFDGIYARNLGQNLTITTGAQSVVRGAGHGIGAMNDGTGNLTITAEGWVAGYGSTYYYEGEDGFTRYTGNGINAENSEDGGSLTITTGAGSTVRGVYHGINADNEGSGALTITADGAVRGTNGSGIYAYNDSGASEDNSGDFTSLSITTGAGSDVFGGKDGIDAINFGFGAFSINVNGRVTGAGEGYSWFGGGGDGIYARNYGTTLTIETGAGSVVTGMTDDGIDANQYGAGDLVITVNGTVTGEGEDGYGIDAFNAGGIFTVLADPYAVETIITVGPGGVAQGNSAGIRAFSEDGQPILITNEGLVRNLSGESSQRAIVTRGAVTTIDNDANLIGTVTLDQLTGFDDTLNNRGFWNTAGGDSDFGGGIGDVVNNTGTLLAADDSQVQELTRLFGLETFNNDGGLISLIDGQAGDQLEISTEDGTVYVGSNARLAVDAALGPGTADPAGDRLSDQLIIEGDVNDSGNGNTAVLVNVVSANGANVDGIPVVRVQGGTTAAGDFTLNGPVSGGFFLWDMRYDAANNWHELYTVNNGTEEQPGDPVLGAGASEFPAGFAATQDIWLQTIGTLLHRQADLRALLQNVSVTPVADYADPVEPTPVGPSVLMAPGFWYKGFGAYVERDGQVDGFDLSNRQTTYGGMAGFDFGTREAFGDALLFGIFGGYIASDLKFDETNTRWNYEGPTVGAYVTYLDHAFYADLTVKADFLDIEIDPDDLATGEDDADTDAVNVGGRLDAGYKMGGAVFLEPQASLAVVHTEIDDVDVFGGTVSFDDDTSVLGRVGARVGVDHTGADATVYTADLTASLWHDFTSANDATISVPGLTDIGVSNDPASTYGDVSLGLSAANPDGWSSFLRANYLFAEDYEAVTGNAGVRFVW